MRILLIIFLATACGRLESHPPVIRSKSFRAAGGFEMPEGKCTFWYNTCASCVLEHFEEDCEMYHIGDTIGKTQNPNCCPIVVIARDSEGRIMCNQPWGWITGTKYQAGDTIR